MVDAQLDAGHVAGKELHLVPGDRGRREATLHRGRQCLGHHAGEERGRAHVRSGDAPAAGIERIRCQFHVVHAHDAPPADVDDLLVEHVAGDEDLAVAPLEGAKIETGTGELHPLRAQLLHRGPGYEDVVAAQPADAHHQARQRWEAFVVGMEDARHGID